MARDVRLTLSPWIRMGDQKQKKPEGECLRACHEQVAGWTGIEPATSGVTGRRSNQLSYHPTCALASLRGVQYTKPDTALSSLA